MKELDEYYNWLNNEEIDDKTKEELVGIKENIEEIKDRFYKNLEFGTGGLRGVLGAGTNRMNIYTVRKATQGLANYIKNKKGEERGVAIAFDSRNMSKEFSEEAALCLNANGIRSYVFESLRPTPELSYTVRKLNCIAGIVITASHNPPEYNGYKVYWEDGGQIVPPIDKEIISEVNKITDYNEVKTISKKEAIERELYTVIGKEIDDSYIQRLKELVLNPDIIRKMAKDIKIVYTPLNGTGNVLVRRILKELGFEKVFIVKEQEEPDGNFPTLKYPNPEDPNAFDLALKLAKEKNADIILATDPDADRLGVYSIDKKTGEYQAFTGNMSGLLIAEYELSQKREKGILPHNGVLVKTIVSSNMADEIVKEYNIKLVEVLTGFKYIGEQIKLFEANKNYEYLFGYEESYGCLIGSYARDKDAVSAVMALCEAAAFYKSKGLTLWDQMQKIYKKYGYYKEGLETITIKGIDGNNKIKEMMENARNNNSEKIGKYKILAVRDYESRVKTDKITGNTESIELPKSNVLYYELENHAWCCVRPSGTEPKIKFYMGVKGKNIEDAEKELKELKKSIMEFIKRG